MSGKEAMVSAAEQTLGMGETRGNNVNAITRWYGLNGEPWCDQGITYWAFHSGNAKAVTGGAKFAYTVAHANWFRSHDRYHSGTAGIKRGDIVFFNWHDGGDTIDHVGLCTGTSGSVVLTIEGNFGNMVGRHVRYSNVIAGYGRPAYDPEPSHPGNPPGGGSKDPGGTYAPFPGEAWFHTSPNSPVITNMGRALIRAGCGRYAVGPSAQWSDSDRQSYAAFQRKCGLSGSDADGWPGKDSWNKLKVSR